MGRLGNHSTFGLFHRNRRYPGLAARLANEAVRSLIAIPAGAVWFGTSDGITYYLPETPGE
jgi:hypothetical protein